MDMRERKYIKFRVDMHEDTKFKIIDRKPERDFIHYAWNRFVALAGKVNLEGDLYMSRNIKYTLETLAIEFNREVDQIKLALDVLIELEMMELTGDKVYRVKNFTKDQNIKIKEKIKSNDSEDDVKNKEVLVIENFKNEIDSNEDKKSENKVIQNRIEDARNDEIYNLEIIHKDIKVNNNRSKNKDNNMGNEKSDNSSQDIIPILLDVKNNKNVNKNKKANKNENKKKNTNIDMIDEKAKDNSIICFYDGDVGRPLEEGESVAKAWSF